jgi:hypothetical protein
VSENSLNSASPYSLSNWKKRPRSSLCGEVADLKTIDQKICKTFTILMLLQFCTTLSASVAPARAAGNVEILSHVGYVDSTGNYHVVGEVQNVGTQAVTFVQVTATFYDSQNRVVDSRFDLTMLNVLLVERKSPFQIALLDVAESSRVNHYSLKVTYSETNSLPTKLAILSYSTRIDYDGSMHVVGRLKNLGDEILVNAMIVATYYDTSSHVVAAASTGFDPELTGDIGPNQIVSFEIQLDKERAQHVATYALEAQSNQYAMARGSPPTDLNGDGQVNIVDVTIVASAFGSRPGSPKWNLDADIDKNGVVNIVDVSIVARDFGKAM